MIGIHFNYKKLRCRLWQFCSITVGICLILAILSVKTYYLLKLVQSTFYLTFFPVLIQNCALIQILTTFNILLYTLHRRFVALNSFLRLLQMIVKGHCRSIEQFFSFLFNFFKQNSIFE